MTENLKYNRKNNIENVQTPSILQKYRQQLAHALELVPEAIVFTDLNFKIINMNKAAEQLYGWKKKEVSGKSLLVAIQFYFINEKVENILRSFFRNGYWKGEVIQRTKDNKTKNVFVSITQILNPEGKPFGTILINYDISQKINIERELKDYKERFKILFEQALDAYYLIDYNAIFMDCNRAVEKLVGYKKNELIGKNYLDFGLLPKALLIKASELLKKNTKGEPTGPDEFALNRKDGSQVLVEISNYPVKIKDTNLILSIVRDITERKRTEEKYRSLFDKSPEGIVILDVDGNILEYNEAQRNIFNLPINNIIGKSFMDLDSIKKDDIKRLMEIFKQIIHGNDVEPFELEITKDGKSLWLELFPRLIKSDDKVEAIQVITRNITERKAMEKALHGSEEKLRSILDSSPNAITVTDLNGIITDCNQATVDLHGFSSRDEIIGLNSFDLIAKQDHERAIENVMVTLKNGLVKNVEYSLLKKTGLEFPGELSASIVRDINSEPNSFVAITKDITERKNAEQELKKYQEHLEELVKERTKQLLETNLELEAYAYSVSHDLRAPLRTIQSFAEVLLTDHGDKLDSNGKEYAKRIISASERLNSLLEDLLFYSKLSNTESDIKPVNLDRILKDVTKQLEQKIKEKKAKINIKKPLGEVMGSNSIFTMIISNLIINALTFVSPGVKPNIKIWSEIHNKNFRLFIEDNGIGINPEYHTKIFKIFERLHSNETYPGTGIGLALVKKGIERIGGMVGVESEEGHGAKFWIELKIKEGKNDSNRQG